MGLSNGAHHWCPVISGFRLRTRDSFYSRQRKLALSVDIYYTELICPSHNNFHFCILWVDMLFLLSSQCKNYSIIVRQHDQGASIYIWSTYIVNSVMHKHPGPIKAFWLTLINFNKFSFSYFLTNESCDCHLWNDWTLFGIIYNIFQSLSVT